MSTAGAYHEFTKYSQESMRSHPGLDWSKAPSQFKDVVGSHRIELRPHGRKPDAKDLRSVLARFLYFANGITGHLVHDGGTQLLRSTPSAGALYPTELYVGVGEEQGVAAGLYSYDPRDEVITRLWDEDPRAALGRACNAEDTFRKARAVIITTGMFWRSAWRYQERGYRRVLLDTGHMLANLASIGPFDGFTSFPHLGFVDDMINGPFFFEADKEGALACVPLVPMEESNGPPALWSSSRSLARVTESQFEGEGNILDEADLTGSATAALHRDSSCLQAGPVKQTGARSSGQPENALGAIPITVDPADVQVQIPRAIAQRRSARSYPLDPIPFDSLKAALQFTFPMFRPHELWDAELLDAHLIVHRVDGLDQGIYKVQGDAEGLLPIKLGDFTAATATACLGQEIAATCAVVLVFTAKAERAIETYGDRAYRYMHLEAGSLGQRFQIAASDLGGQACGIGGFFDDDFAALLELPKTDWVLYPVTAGAAG